jgi:hypothetical protein
MNAQGGDMRVLKTIFAVAITAFFVAVAAKTQQKKPSDSEYIAQALSAGPEAVAKGAAVIRVEENGNVRTLRAGKKRVYVHGHGHGQDVQRSQQHGVYQRLDETRAASR